MWRFGGWSKMASFFDSLEADDKAEREKRAGFRAADYTGDKCKNCGRVRVMNCANGRHVCEKCGWDADRNEYCADWSPLR